MVALSTEEIRRLAEAGAAAPSGGNAQPWRLVASSAAGTLELSLDPERSQSFIDVDRMGSILALGSFTENVCLAAAGLGLRLEVELSEAAGPGGPLVRFECTGRDDAASVSPLTNAIFERATNRRSGNGVAIDAVAIESLCAAARSAGERNDVSAVGSDEGKRAIARALAEADVVRTFNRSYHTQMLSEMRWTPEEALATADGIDVATLELPASALSGLKLMRRRWFVALMVTRNRVRSMTVEGLLSSSHLCALTMPKETSARNLFGAGRALERAWLTAHSLGLSLQPWSVIPFFVLRAELHPETLPPREVATVLELGAELDRLFSIPAERRSIFVFRLSRAEPPSVRARRRAVDLFTTIDGARGVP